MGSEDTNQHDWRTAEVVIPAHLESRRLPRKLLLDRTGKPLIRHTCEAVMAVLGVYPWVATDSDEIAAAVAAFGAPVIMTGAHQNGTCRVAEAARELDYARWIINIQGDEPEISGDAIRTIIGMIYRFDEEPAVSILTLGTPLATGDMANRNRVKVAVLPNQRAMLFSREPVEQTPHCQVTVLRHLGVYCYRRDFLVADVPVSASAQAERLEQLAWMDAGYQIVVGTVDSSPASIDTPEDYADFCARVGQV